MSEDTYNPVAAPEADAIDAIEPDVVLDLTDDASEEESEEVTETPAWLKPGKWYVVHSQSGYDKKVSTSLRDNGVGFWPFWLCPTKPVTPGVLRMQNHVSSSISQRTKR